MYLNPVAKRHHQMVSGSLSISPALLHLLESFFSDFNGSRAAAPAGKKSCRKLKLKKNPLKELREL